MTRLLNQWGLGPSLAKVAVRCSQYCFKEGRQSTYLSHCYTHLILILADTGEILGSINLLESFFKELKADFMFIQVRAIDPY
jgi:salicylate hydroxylase